MVEIHTLNEDQFDRVHEFETALLPRQMDKRKFAQQLQELEWAFGDRLRELLSTPHINHIGTWSNPSEDSVLRASRLILGRTLVFARHDPAKAGSAQDAGHDMRTLREDISQTILTIEGITRRTRDHLRDHGGETYKTLKAIKKAMRSLEKALGEPALDFPTGAVKGIHPRAISLYEFVVLVYVQTTGVYPSITAAAKSRRSKTSAREQHSYARIKPPPADWARSKHDSVPPLLQIIRCAVDSVEAPQGKSSGKWKRTKMLSANSFEKCVDELRPTTMSK